MATQLLCFYLDLLLLCSYSMTNEFMAITTSFNLVENKNRLSTDASTVKTATRLRKGCQCQNGGTCILGSFCSCPNAFKGRHCEEFMGNRSCGALRHDAIQLDFTGDCQLCRCTDGTFICDDQYTCDDLTNYARLNPRINVARGHRNITLSMADNSEDSQSNIHDWLLILPHFPNNLESSAQHIGCQYFVYIFSYLLLKLVLFFT